MPNALKTRENAPDYKNQLAVMAEAARHAGEMARTFQKEGFERLENKDKGDPFLTEADLALDKYLRETLTAAFPDYGWLSEETETDDTSLDNEFCFIVDPIDGTRGFVNGKSSFSVSVGLVHNGAPVVGAVCAPMEDVLVSGAVGAGVFVNGTAVAINQKDLPDTPEVLVSGTEVKNGMWQKPAENFDIKPMGSVAYKLALLAAGRADGVVSLKPKNLHDVCAGHAMLNAMGGQLLDLTQKPVPYTKTGFLLTGVVAGPTAAAVDAFFQRLRPFLEQSA